MHDTPSRPHLSPGLCAGVARQTCFLERHERDRLPAPLQPPGLSGWEVTLPDEVQPLLSALIPDGAGGRNLFVSSGGPRPVARGGRPSPTTPLLVRATHRSLRILCFGAPGEALDLGQRLSLLCTADLTAVTTTECAPALVADLLLRYVQAAPATEALLEPGGMRRPQMLGWVQPWSREQIFAGRPGELMVPESEGLVVDLSHAARPSGGYGLFSVRSYAHGRPTTLAPVALVLDPPGIEQERLARLLQEPEVLEPLFADCAYGVVPLRITPMMINLLMPLRADNWHEHLLSLREDLSQRLGMRLGYFSVQREDFLDMVRNLEVIRPQLYGAEDVDPPRRGGPRPEPAEVEPLLSTLMRSLEIDFDPDPLLRTVAEQATPRYGTPVARA